MSAKFYNLTVKDVRKETTDTVSIAFEVPITLKKEFAFEAGQYLTLKTTINGAEVRRSYSICASPTENDLRVAVKKIDKGVFSSFATEKINKGDQMEVMVPQGNFKVQPDENQKRNYVFFAAGSGITPVISMIKAISEKEKNSTVTLFYSNKTKADIIFKNELDNLSANSANIKVNYLLSREDSGNSILNGRIDKLKCENLNSNFLADQKIDGIYLCGPQEMIMTVKDFYISKGIAENKIHFELFTATAAPKEEGAENSGPAVDASVTVIIDDEPYTFNLNTKGKSILQAAQDAGADVPFSCKGGVCCTCKAKVMEGTTKMDLNYALDADEVEEGFILTCQAHPTSTKVTVSFDEY